VSVEWLLVKRLPAVCCKSESAHARIAQLLWDAGSDADAMQQLEQLAQQELVGWEQQRRERGSAGSDEAATQG
jgi:hypothetical protein